MSEKCRILIVDDEFHQRKILRTAAESLGYEVTEAENGAKALEQLRFGKFDILVTDLQMPQMNGLDLLKRTRITDPSVSVIVVTAHGTVETAVEAMKLGAEDYIQKPIDLDSFDLCLTRVFRKRALARDNSRLQSEVNALKKELKVRYQMSSALGKSDIGKRLREKADAFSRTRSSLLILGEPGTGKKDFARAVHYNGPWSENNLIFFDCATVPSELHAHHLFGEEMSSEGGVRTSSRPGLVERAHLGTLVISNLPKLEKSCQTLLSRVIRESKTQRTGGSKFYPVDLRILVTSSREEFEKPGTNLQLWQELFSFLKENSVELPAVREMREDLPVLIAATVKRLSFSLGRNITRIHPSVIDRLFKYDYPGNLRELSSIIEAALIRTPADQEELQLQYFGPER